jgi:hypothetical protein
MQLSTTLQQVDPLFINMIGRWHSIWQRCYVTNDQNYEYYGARGISVCQEWVSFESFYAFWGNPPFEDATIGRINNDGNYEPGNCEWQTQEQQNNNTRRSKLITFNGKTQSIRDWAFEYNIGTRRLWERLRRGWDMQKSLNTPCPQDFATELANRREKTNALWAINGHLYNARSKHRRGHKLSLHMQDLLAVEGSDPVLPSKLEKTSINQCIKTPARKYSKISLQQKEQILALRGKGASLRKIANLFDISKSTVDNIIKKPMKTAAFLLHHHNG